jgi:serpin B
VLPQSGPEKLAELEQSLSAETLQTWTSQLGHREVDLFLPRFQFERRSNLIPALKTLGMESAFNITADFSGIAGDESGPLLSVLHQARIDVDEEGTTAAAATYGGFFGGAPPGGPAVFRADRPFLLLIQDSGTGCVLFIGRVLEAR